MIGSMCQVCERLVKQGLVMGSHETGVLEMTLVGWAIVERAGVTGEARMQLLDHVAQQLEAGTLHFRDLPVYVRPQRVLTDIDLLNRRIPPRARH